MNLSKLVEGLKGDALGFVNKRPYFLCLFYVTTDREIELKNFLNLQVYFGKTNEMVCTLRPPAELVQMKLPDT